MADPTNEQLDDIISMLDSFMNDGGGRMNIEARSISGVSEQTIQNEKFFGCGVAGKRKMACQTPTLMEGLDIDDKNN